MLTFGAPCVLNGAIFLSEYLITNLEPLFCPQIEIRIFIYYVTFLILFKKNLATLSVSFVYEFTVLTPEADQQLTDTGFLRRGD